MQGLLGPETLGTGAPAPRGLWADRLRREVCALAHVPIFGERADPPEERGRSTEPPRGHTALPGGSWDPWALPAAGGKN